MAFETEKDELLKLAEINDGLLTVDAVLEAAQDEFSPLHRHFEWDDSAAANEYRRWQARALIAKCRIVLETRDDTEVRAFLSVPSDRKNGGGYRVSAEVLDDSDRREELLQEMRQRVNYWQRQATFLDSKTRQAVSRFASEITAEQQAVA